MSSEKPKKPGLELGRFPDILKKIIPIAANLFKVGLLATVLGFSPPDIVADSGFVQNDNLKTKTGETFKKNPTLTIDIDKAPTREEVEKLVNEVIGDDALKTGSTLNLVIRKDGSTLSQKKIKILGDPTTEDTKESQIEAITKRAYKDVNQEMLDSNKSRPPKNNSSGVQSKETQLEAKIDLQETSELKNPTFKKIYNKYFAWNDFAKGKVKIFVWDKNQFIQVDKVLELTPKQEKAFQIDAIKALREILNLQEFKNGTKNYNLRDTVILTSLNLTNSESKIDTDKLKSLVEKLSDHNGKTVNDIKWEVYNHLAQKLAKALTNLETTKVRKEETLRVIEALQKQTGWNFKEHILAAVEKIENEEMINPVNGEKSSGYGYRVHPITGEVKFHEGVDYAAPEGTPVFAAGKGTVIFAGWGGGYGNMVIILHPNGTETLYAHLRDINVVQDQQIKRAGSIGSVGSTGLSTGSHLHFELSYKGKSMDPTKSLPGSTRTAKTQQNESLIYQILFGNPPLTAPQIPNRK